MAIILLIYKASTRWRRNLKGLFTREMIGKNLLKILAPLPVSGIYQMIPLPAKQISLDSPFKYFICCSYSSWN